MLPLSARASGETPRYGPQAPPLLSGVPGPLPTVSETGRLQSRRAAPAAGTPPQSPPDNRLPLRPEPAYILLPPTGYASGPGTASPPYRSQEASIPAVPCPLISPARRPLLPPGRQNMVFSSDTSGSSSFPLGGAVAFAGSRHGSPFPVTPVVSAVLSAGGSVRVGCASGVDAAVRSCCPSAVVLRALSFSGPPHARLAARTRAVVSGASALCVFPPAGGVLGPGSTLAVRCALSTGIPVWCAGPRPSVSASWSPLRLAGIPGFACLPASSLF